MFSKLNLSTIIFSALIGVTITLLVYLLIITNSENVYENKFFQSNIVVQIIALEKSSNRVRTYREAENVENRYELFLERYSFQDIKNELESLCHSLKHRSIQYHCDNIDNVINIGPNSVDWSDYGEDNEAYYVRWKHIINNGVPHGYEQKISSENRLKLLATSIIIRKLVQDHYESLRNNYK